MDDRRRKRQRRRREVEEEAARMRGLTMHLESDGEAEDAFATPLDPDAPEVTADSATIPAPPDTSGETFEATPAPAIDE